MRPHMQRMLVMTGAALVGGCHAATRVADVPRVDLKLEGGNRGYLIGTPPEGAALKPTRQMVATDIELPSFYRPTHGGTSVSPEGSTSSSPGGMAAEEAEGEEAVPQRYDTYVVHKGESLWTIAAKPEIYGKATRWRRIFDANRDLLKSPDRVRPGMKLKIPRGEARGSREKEEGNEGTIYAK